MNSFGSNHHNRSNSITSETNNSLNGCHSNTAAEHHLSTVGGKGPIKATRKIDLSLVERLKEAGILPSGEIAEDNPPTFRED